MRGRRVFKNVFTILNPGKVYKLCDVCDEIIYYSRWFARDLERVFYR